MSSGYIVISPYSRRLRNGKNNPKNYPYWDQVIDRVSGLGYDVVQIGENNESKFNKVKNFIIGANFDKLKSLVNNSKTFISVDNFFPHFCAYSTNVGGVVIFSLSDPNIFGYAHNINLLKDRSYLRKEQFGIWEAVEFNRDAFVEPLAVTAAVESQISMNKLKGA